MANAEVTSPPAEGAADDKRRSAASDKQEDDFANDGNDAFEDAVDGTSVRSLTHVQTPPPLPTPTPKLEEPSPAVEQEKKEGDTVAVVATNGAPIELRDNEVQEETTESNKVKKEQPEEQNLEQAAASRRSSTDSAVLDNVNLDDDAAPQEQNQEAKNPAETKEPSKKLSLTGIANSLPSLPWSPSQESSQAKSPTNRSGIFSISNGPSPQPASQAVAPAPPTVASQPPPPPTRKLTSPFSWLSRNSGSKDKDSTGSPPPTTSPRRNTASSVATMTSNPELMLGRLDEEKEGDAAQGGHRVGKDSLKDRFKMVRMREEAGITPEMADMAEDDKRSSATGMVSSSTENGEDKESAVKSPSSTAPTSPNPSHGTKAEAQVDWDLWQSVVYEGPAAVARTSPEELNKAIANGIPSAIRGVVWQVLAHSKNDELEMRYRELSVKGTDKDRDRHSNGTTASSASNGNLSIQSQGDQIASSASSVHSDHSGAVNGMASPTAGSDKNSEVQPRPQFSPAERKRREKEEAAALQKLEKTIKRDMGSRTSLSRFAAAEGLQDGLFGICKAYALYDEEVGYAQGMNFLVMPLLFNMPEEEAFCLLVRLMYQYKLRDMFVPDMPGLHKSLYQFERLLEDYEPALYCHLHRKGISPHLYATQWFLTLFAYRFPLQLVLRIYDLILSEGITAILRFGLVLMQKNAAILLSMTDMQQLKVFLKDKLFDVYIDKAPSAGSILENGFFGSSSSNIDKEVYHADQLVRDACDFHITGSALVAYGVEWEEKTRAEREREEELEHLRSSNAKYAVTVRKLEERIEAVDGEQAALATELVHTKVENQELRDENESLRGQVRELRIVIEKQPEEIEEAWKLERDDLMKRNEKVHEENQKVEKEMAELEEELVQTKMRYAELNSSHETLTRRWTDLKRQFA